VAAATLDPVKSEFDSVILESEQEELLTWMIEAERRVPRQSRGSFVLVENWSHSILIFPGVDERPLVSKADLESLADYGFLRRSLGSRGGRLYDVTPTGKAYYSFIKRRAGEPADRVETEIRRYIEADAFRLKHPGAYERWAAAEELLWASETDKQYTDIGHRCREAMQRLANDLVEANPSAEVDPDPAHTVARLRAVIKVAAKGERVRDLLEALVHYWGTVSDLVQRQEHGDQKQEALLWEDARLVVFQTAQVMFEVSRILGRATRGKET
jgi:hypothetical protein